jgi:RNA polymerase sigma factor (sigma-70 family)
MAGNWVSDPPSEGKAGLRRASFRSGSADGAGVSGEGMSREKILYLLVQARNDPPPDEWLRLQAALRAKWLRIGRVKWPRYPEEVEAACNMAMVTITEPRVLEGLRDPSRIECFAAGVFMNALYDEMRTIKRHKPLVPLAERPGMSDDRPQVRIEHRESLRWVLAFLDRLEPEVPRVRRVLELKMSGVSEREIGEELGITRNQVLHVVKRLRRCLRESGVSTALGGRRNRK